ncbi:MAG: bacteriocin [Saprospirales bacterium]|nr:bacteriocin [Saprospirales bacterium]MBK8490248.1 bacteriocin [Saprospirales bacterium]
MGKSKKKDLEDLKKDLKELKKEEMKNIVGGRDKKNRWKRWLNICGNILPQ